MRKSFGLIATAPLLIYSTSAISQSSGITRVAEQLVAAAQNGNVAALQRLALPGTKLKLTRGADPFTAPLARLVEIIKEDCNVRIGTGNVSRGLIIINVSSCPGTQGRVGLIELQFTNNKISDVFYQSVDVVPVPPPARSQKSGTS